MDMDDRVGRVRCSDCLRASPKNDWAGLCMACSPPALVDMRFDGCHKGETVAGSARGLDGVDEAVKKHMDEAERKAVDALSRYKFQMFGYWAGVWVHLNRLAGELCPQRRRENPFRGFVRLARESVGDRKDCVPGGCGGG